MTSIPITRPARSVLDEAPDNLKAFVASLTGMVAQGANWMVRKKTLCDTMLSLGAYLSMSPEEKRRMADGLGRDLPPDDDADEGADEGEASRRFAEMLPFYVGAILERMDEDRVASAEQAAVYVLSIHPEHQAAAEAWMMADPRNAKAVRRIVKADKRFATLLKTARAPGGNAVRSLARSLEGEPG
ncbi:MAG TPA: hypothetical protein VD995_16590 [Azospirillum sp.]|nr:hypothetical protein [Azospirillum sp.]